MGAVISVLYTVLLSPIVIALTYFASRGTTLNIHYMYLVGLFFAWLFSMSKLSLATGGLTEQQEKNRKLYTPLSVLFASTIISLLVIKYSVYYK
jgi:hypothetical protein